MSQQPYQELGELLAGLLEFRLLLREVIAAELAADVLTWSKRGYGTFAPAVPLPPYEPRLEGPAVKFVRAGPA